MTIKGDYILFFGTDWPSNFASSPIVVQDDFWSPTLIPDPEEHHPDLITFKTAEAYFQSRKAVMAGDENSYYKIALAPTPAETKRIARKIKLDSKKWDEVRVKYMWETLKLKFEQNPKLLKKLLDPRLEGKHFVEASPYDSFWGVGRGERELIEEINSTGGIELFDSERGIPIAHNSLGELLEKLRKFEYKKWKKEN